MGEYHRPTLFGKDAFVYDKMEDFVGAGVLGRVYRARIRDSGEIVALKMLSCSAPPKLLNEWEKDCLKKEVAILQQLAHCPNVIRLTGVCVDPHHYALVMEYVENRDLEDLLVFKQTLHPYIQQWECRIRMGLDIARGMNFLHNQMPPIIHRDLKSANVLVDSNYCCKITDFGLSKTRGISSCTLIPFDGDHKYNVGTLAFVAPERFKGEAISLQHLDKADVYGFSIVLWQLKEMKQPYRGESDPATVCANVRAGVRPQMSSDDCPPQFRDLIAQCWRQCPQKRPAFDDITMILQTILQSVTLEDSNSQPPTLYSDDDISPNGLLPDLAGFPTYNTSLLTFPAFPDSDADFPFSYTSVSAASRRNSLPTRTVCPMSRQVLSAKPNAVRLAENGMAEQRNRFPSLRCSTVPHRTRVRSNGVAATTTIQLPAVYGTHLFSTDRCKTVSSPVLDLTTGTSVHGTLHLGAPISNMQSSLSRGTAGAHLQLSHLTRLSTEQMDTTQCGTSSDEIELIEEVLPSKRKRLSYGRGCAHVLQEPMNPDERKWKRWPDLPVRGAFRNRVAANRSTLVVAGKHRLYSLNFFHVSELYCSRWAEHNHGLGSFVELQRIFTTSASWFATYVKGDRQGIATFDLAEGTWTHVCDLPPYRKLQNYSVTGNEHYAYIVGGENKTQDEVCDTVLKYDMQIGRLCGTRKLKSKRESGCSVIINDTLYVGGGSDGKQLLQSVERMNVRQFDYSGPDWYLSPTPTYQCSLSSAGGVLIATGGSSNNSVAVNSAWKLLLLFKNDRWHPLPSMNDERCYHGLCGMNGQVVAVGGKNREGCFLSSVESPDR